MTRKKPTKTTPSWSDVKTKLADLDRADLLGLIKDLYTANKDTKVFLHTRFGLGDDPLGSYKEEIARWINPPDYRDPISVSKAKKAISDYKKALGQPEGLAELSVFYCEEALDFLDDYGVEDEDFYNSLVIIFEQALKYVLALPKVQQLEFLNRLNRVRQLGRNVGWGIGEDFNVLWSHTGLMEAT
jgi:hypothetical protein